MKDCEEKSIYINPPIRSSQNYLCMLISFKGLWWWKCDDDENDESNDINKNVNFIPHTRACVLCEENKSSMANAFCTNE